MRKLTTERRSSCLLVISCPAFPFRDLEVNVEKLLMICQKKAIDNTRWLDPATVKILGALKRFALHRTYNAKKGAR